MVIFACMFHKGAPIFPAVASLVIKSVEHTGEQGGEGAGRRGRERKGIGREGREGRGEGGKGKGNGGKGRVKRKGRGRRQEGGGEHQVDFNE